MELNDNNSGTNNKDYTDWYSIQFKKVRRNYAHSSLNSMPDSDS